MATDNELPPALKAEKKAIENTAEGVEETESSGRDDAPPFDFTSEGEDAEALAAFEDGSTVDTPDGMGIIDDIVTEGTVDGMDASEGNPVYAVVVEDENVGVGFYREGDLSDGDLPESGPDAPEQDLEAMADVANAVDDDAEALADGFFEWPQSWQDSEEPARLIALRAWAGMGGSFTGCTREMRGELTGSPDRFCADFKDRLYGTDLWRGGWAD